MFQQASLVLTCLEFRERDFNLWRFNLKNLFFKTSIVYMFQTDS